MKRGSRAPQHSKQQVRQPGRRKKQPDTQREGPIQQKLDWARTPPGNNRGEGGDSHTHHKQHNREPQCKGGETERPQKRHEPTKAHNQAKGDNHRKNTERNQPKQQNKGQPKGRGWTATMRRQSGGGAEGAAIRTHRATWPMRAEISDTQGTHSLGHNIKLTTKGVKHGPERAREERQRRESLRHTSCNVFEVMVFVRSKGLIPTIANREGNRMQRFLLFGTKTQPVALVPKGYLIIIRHPFS